MLGLSTHIHSCHQTVSSYHKLFITFQSIFKVNYTFLSFFRSPFSALLKKVDIPGTELLSGREQFLPVQRSGFIFLTLIVGKKFIQYPLDIFIDSA